MRRINIIAVRHQGDEVGGCCGCGEDSIVYYEIIGRDDFEKKEHNFAIFLCYQCYRPLMKGLETKEAKREDDLR